MSNLIEIRNLSIDAEISKSHYNIINKLNINIPQQSIISIVGESGSGKTITALSIVKLLEKNLKITSGEILFEGKNILEFNEEEMMNIRGRKISFIFQEPMTALNPVINIETQLIEGPVIHKIASKDQAIEMAKELLKKLDIPLSKLKLYPHNLSGGQRQRILIAMALITSPQLLIADEPTTALDVITQLDILEIIKELKEEKKLSVMLITHNFAIVSNYSSYTYVMYMGEIMEAGKTSTIINSPKHPYTIALLSSIIKLNDQSRLKSIKGLPPLISELKDGCRFMTRCEFATEICKKEPPVNPTPDGYYRCWNR